MKKESRFAAIMWVVAAIVITVVIFAVKELKKPDHMDVIAAQSMDMSSLKLPAGPAPVELAALRMGSIGDAVTYTGSVKAFNEQEISARITGRIVALPVYPGDSVQRGQVLATLDTAEVAAKADQARAEAAQAARGAKAAALTANLYQKAALRQANAQVAAEARGLSDAKDQAESAQEAINEANAAVQSAQSNDQYWISEIGREKKLADAGAVSQQEYQSELAQAQSADAALVQAKSKARQAVSASRAAQDRVAQQQSALDAAHAASEMASASVDVAAQQSYESQDGASAAAASARQAEVIQGYSQILSPANGVITERPISPGTLVQAGSLILGVAEIDQVRVQANVSVNDLAGIAPGSPVQLEVQGDTSSKPIAGRVTSVFPSADIKTRTDIVEAVVPNPGHRLLPGAFVSMSISKRSTGEKLLAPTEAIRKLGGVESVWVVRREGAGSSHASEYECEKCKMRFSAADAKKNGYVDPMDGGRLLPIENDTTANAPLIAHRITVLTGASDGSWTEINTNDLRPGDRVVTHGSDGLSEGMRVAQQ